MSINISDLSTSKYIASADFKVGTILPALTIERIEKGEVPTPGKKQVESKPVVWFRGATKGYVLTKNVARAIAAKLGVETTAIDKHWPGISISLEVVADVRRPDGTRGNAFRLHNAWPKPAAPSEQTANQPASQEAAP